MGWRRGWLDGIGHEPGRNAGYRAGRNRMDLVVEHFTVGRCAGDRAIMARGVFQFYVPRSRGCGPGITQAAEVDASCGHACEWNVRGPGIEFERLSWNEQLTDYQIEAGGFLLRALRDLGVPNVHYDGPRLPIGAPFRGFVNHRALVHRACDQHTDGCTGAEHARMMGGAPAPGPSPLPPPAVRRIRATEEGAVLISYMGVVEMFWTDEKGAGWWAVRQGGPKRDGDMQLPVIKLMEDGRCKPNSPVDGWVETVDGESRIYTSWESGKFAGRELLEWRPSKGRGGDWHAQIVPNKVKA